MLYCFQNLDAFLLWFVSSSSCFHRSQKHREQGKKKKKGKYDVLSLMQCSAWSCCLVIFLPVRFQTVSVLYLSSISRMKWLQSSTACLISIFSFFNLYVVILQLLNTMWFSQVINIQTDFSFLSPPPPWLIKAEGLKRVYKVCSIITWHPPSPKISNSNSDPVCDQIKRCKMGTRKMDMNVRWKKEFKMK